MSEIIYLYDGTFEGFLCCIFNSYANQEVPTAIQCDEDSLPTLFPCRTIQTVPAHADRVLRKVLILSPYAGELLRKGFLTCLPEKECALYRMTARLLKDGSGFLRDLSDADLYPVAKAVRHLDGEAHLLKGFIRFSDFGGILGSEISPKNRVLPILRSHFCARYLNECFFIYDRTHQEALFYADGKSVIRHLDDFQMAPPDETEAHYRLLWKRFYDTVAIRERYNPRCRMTQMPKRYWASMTEFQSNAAFIPGSSPEGAVIPCVPAGRSAPETPEGDGPSAAASAP